MKMAQDLISQYNSGHTKGAFNSRLHGISRSTTMDGARGEVWAERHAGWNLADEKIKNGEIYSRTEIDGQEIEFKCYLDGNAWCCVGPDFIDLAVSPATFDEDRDIAIKLFAAQETVRKQLTH